MAGRARTAASVHSDGGDKKTALDSAVSFFKSRLFCPAFPGFTGRSSRGGRRVPSKDYSPVRPRFAALLCESRETPDKTIMKNKTSKSKSTVKEVATITVDTDPTNLQPFTLIYKTPSATRRYPFCRIVEAVWLAKWINKRVNISVEVCPA